MSKRNKIELHNSAILMERDVIINITATKLPNNIIRSYIENNVVDGYGTIKINVVDKHDVSTEFGFIHATIRRSIEYNLYYCIIDDIQVDEEYRNNDIGSKMLEKLEEILDHEIYHSSIIDTIDTLICIVSEDLNSIDFFKNREFYPYKNYGITSYIYAKDL